MYVNKFSYYWSKERQSFCIFDDMDEPVMETLEYLSSLSGLSKNTQEGHAVALMAWFEFLNNAYKLAIVSRTHPCRAEIHFANAETKHIVDFQRWLKTKPDERDKWDRTLNMKEHTTASTRNQHINKISLFYKRYVKPRYPASDIAFTHENSYNPKQHDPRHQKELLTHKEKERRDCPDTRSIPPEVFRKIKDCATENYGSINRPSTRIRNGLILDLAYIVGPRRGEITNIDIRQFKTIDRSKLSFLMTIHDSSHSRTDNKTKTGSRQVFIPTPLAINIAVYIEQHRVRPKMEHNILFTQVKEKNAGLPLNGTGISSLFKAAAVKAGYPQYSIHDCRHSAVTNANSLGVKQAEVMDMVGHKDPKTTEGYRSRHGVSRDMDNLLASIYSLMQIED
jgi:integrase